MKHRVVASFKKLLAAKVKADEQLAQDVNDTLAVFEDKARANASESNRIKENISRGARLSKHRFTL